MCMIICKEVGAKLPKESILRRCAWRNQDGVGIAYAMGDRVRIKKDFVTMTEFIAWAEHHITDEMGAIIHFRMATQGLNDMGNRHPFPVTDDMELMRIVEQDSMMAVAHNGVFYGYQHEKYSDTMMFISKVLSEPLVRDNLEHETMSELLDGYILGSKLAFLKPNGVILKFGTFLRSKGCYYSNDGYKDTLEESQTRQIGFAPINVPIMSKINGVVDEYDTDFCANCLLEFEQDELVIEVHDGEEYPLCGRCLELGLKLDTPLSCQQDDNQGGDAVIDIMREGA